MTESQRRDAATPEVAPDTVLGFCARCSTALLERDKNRCRGCGAVCDPSSPLSVVSGIQMSRAASRNGMRPITWRLNLLALLAGGVLLWDGRFPAAFPPSLSSRGVVLAAVAMGLWGFWTVLKIGLMANHQLPFVHIFMDWKKRLILPAILVVCTLLLCTDVPFRLAFALSRSSFEREVQAALSAPDQKAVPGAASFADSTGQRVGFFWIDGVARHGQEVRFYGYLPPQGLRHSAGRYIVFSRSAEEKSLPPRAKNLGNGWWAW